MAQDWLRSTRRALVRAEASRRGGRGGMVTTAIVCVAAGFLISSAATASRGIDLRPNRNTDLISLVESQGQRNQQLARDLTALRAQVDALTAAQAPVPDLNARLQEAADAAELRPVTGQGVTVTLTDAPLSVNPAGVSADLLVVHQQDIQAVVNALWAGGAEAMTIQGQRVTARTGVKCVGNTVVLHGVPYAPPYVISAIGDQAQLEAALATSAYLINYRQYVAAYSLGWSQQRASLKFPGLEGSADLTWAKVRP